jgi:hypothetical protein
MDVTSQEEDGRRSGQGDEAGDDKNNSIVVVVGFRDAGCMGSLLEIYLTKISGRALGHSLAPFFVT